MATESNEKTFMFILRGGKSHLDMSPSDYDQVIRKYLSWIESLRQSGVYKAGDPLESGGKVLSGKTGSLVTDGPFAESKETVGGYFMITAADLDAASQIAMGCPIFDNDGTVEVRQVAPKPQPQ